MASNERDKYPRKTAEDYLIEEERLANNPNRRTPVTVCLDCSFSMRQQRRLERMMEGMEGFCKEMKADPNARDSVELCIISYGGTMARVEQDFTPPEDLIKKGLPHLEAEGETPLVDAVETALDNLERRKVRYSDNGITYYRPWLILIGDGDESRRSAKLDQTAKRLKEESDAKHITALCIVVGDENKTEYSSLRRLAPDGKVLYLRDLKFGEFFKWLSRSIEKTSQSLFGEELHYEATSTWGETFA